mmetsp:Transcript_39448/g.91512  ORF Transcript_39448/g.91512 Transcript_39448/m.91512 type:complete len:258 (+) Transcript_39448:781-1554(+)
MIGTRARNCHLGSETPLKRTFPSAIQIGSLVLTTCVKETEPQEKATQVNPLPTAWKIAAGISLHKKSRPMDWKGEATAPLTQPIAEHATTAVSCITEMVHACGKRPTACLFTMLNVTLAAYQKKKPHAKAAAPADISALFCSVCLSLCCMICHSTASFCSSVDGAMFIADSCKCTWLTRLLPCRPLPSAPLGCPNSRDAAGLDGGSVKAGLEGRHPARKSGTISPATDKHERKHRVGFRITGVPDCTQWKGITRLAQ